MTSKIGVKTRKLDEVLAEKPPAPEKAPEETKVSKAPEEPKKAPEESKVSSPPKTASAKPVWRVVKDCRIVGGAAGGYTLRAGKLVGPATGYDIDHLLSCGAELEPVAR